MDHLGSKYVTIVLLRFICAMFFGCLFLPPFTRDGCNTNYSQS